jgi:hypothetical protein
MGVGGRLPDLIEKKKKNSVNFGLPSMGRSMHSD